MQASTVSKELKVAGFTLSTSSSTRVRGARFFSKGAEVRHIKGYPKDHVFIDWHGAQADRVKLVRWLKKQYTNFDDDGVTIEVW